MSALCQKQTHAVQQKMASRFTLSSVSVLGRRGRESLLNIIGVFIRAMSGCLQRGAVFAASRHFRSTPRIA
jgi:hypothetical protein